MSDKHHDGAERAADRLFRAFFFFISFLGLIMCVLFAGAPSYVAGPTTTLMGVFGFVVFAGAALVGIFWNKFWTWMERP